MKKLLTILSMLCSVNAFCQNDVDTMPFRTPLEEYLWVCRLNYEYEKNRCKCSYYEMPIIRDSTGLPIIPNEYKIVIEKWKHDNRKVDFSKVDAIDGDANPVWHLYNDFVLYGKPSTDSSNNYIGTTDTRPLIFKAKTKKKK